LHLQRGRGSLRPRHRTGRPGATGATGASDPRRRCLLHQREQTGDGAAGPLHLPAVAVAPPACRGGPGTASHRHRAAGRRLPAHRPGPVLAGGVGAARQLARRLAAGRRAGRGTGRGRRAGGRAGRRAGGRGGDRAARRRGDRDPAGRIVRGWAARFLADPRTWLALAGLVVGAALVARPLARRIGAPVWLTAAALLAAALV